MNFSLETARKAAKQCRDPEAAYVIYSLIGEVERSGRREAELEEDLLDLQLKLSVLLAKLSSKDAEQKPKSSITGKVIEISPGVVLDGKFVEGLQTTGSVTDAVIKYLKY